MDPPVLAVFQQRLVPQLRARIENQMHNSKEEMPSKR